MYHMFYNNKTSKGHKTICIFCEFYKKKKPLVMVGLNTGVNSGFVVTVVSIIWMFVLFSIKLHVPS